MKRFEIEIYDDNDIFIELEEARKCSREKDVSAVLIHVYTGLNDRIFVDNVLNELATGMPHAMIVGCTSGGEIFEGRMIDQGIVISVSIFYKTEIAVHTYAVTPGQEAEAGEEIRKTLDDTKDIKAAELLVNCWALDASPLFAAINHCSLRIKIFGASPGAHELSDLTAPKFVFANNGDENTTVVVITYAGEDFHITTDYAVGWKPLGAKMHITRAEGNTLYEVNHRPAFEIYDKYLNLLNDAHFFEHVYEFPLMLYIDDTYVLRTPFLCHDSGEISMVAAIPNDVTVYLSYGDPDTVLAEVYQCRTRVEKFHPDSIFLYSCVVRKVFWNRSVNNEMKLFQTVAPSIGFFTGGELLRVNGKLFHFNSTLLVIGMREGYPSPEALLTETQLERREGNTHRRIPLVKRMASFINVAMQELQDVNRQLSKTSVTDELTQLYNRREFNSRIAACQEEKKTFSLVMLDIDNFKRINDTFGHDLGDSVLQDLSELIRKVVREMEAGTETPIAGRWGGEEFMLLLPGMKIDGAANVAERLRASVEAHAFKTGKPVTISLGVADSRNCSSMTALYQEVDTALYAAKNSGKNRVVRADEVEQQD